MNAQNRIAFGLVLISLICLYPGLVYDILSIEINTELPLLGKINLYSSQQSILETIQSLHRDNNTLVAFLILFFSVMVPIIKALILIMVLFVKDFGARKQWFNFVKAIGKWSMADVFVVGVFLAFLGTRSNENINAALHPGFYYFLAYCLISLLAIQLMKIE